jgi:hypothetical protein
LHKKYKDLKATHPGAQALLNGIEDKIDEYSREVKEVYKPAWENRKNLF